MAAMRHLPAAVLLLLAAPAGAAEIGPCRFDPESLGFGGSAVEQAECLLRHVGHRGELSPQLLPAILHGLLEAGGAPSPAQLDRAIASFPEPYRSHSRTYAQWPASATEAGLPLRYFVIHHTSMPFIGSRRFPRRIDTDREINDFAIYFRDEPVAHVFVNRTGQVWGAHDLGEAWRATKLESYVVGRPARGRMVHIELVQPRREAHPGSGPLDTVGPRPGFSPAQYRQLAALYVYASARAGAWLIPAFHATVDAGIPDAHDDPDGFRLERFAAELARLVGRKQ